MTRINAKFVSKKLNSLQIPGREQLSKVMLDNIIDNPIFIKRSITCNETWIY